MAQNYPGDPAPLVLSGQLTAFVAAGRYSFDISINEIPFLLKPSNQDPRLVQLLEGVKEQFDDSGEAGENSFGDWWLRSQGTFHGGQGQEFLDTVGDPTSRFRYATSESAKVSTPGRATVWHGQLGDFVDNTYRFATRARWDSTDIVAVAETAGNNVVILNMNTLATLETVPVGAIPQALASDGVNIFVAVNDSVVRIDRLGTVTTIHDTDLSFGTSPVSLAFCHERLILAIGPSVWELDPHPVTTPDSSHTVHFVHTTPEWRYTAIAEGPNGIYLAGYSGARSTVSSMTLTDEAGTVTMGQPVVHAELPLGEETRKLLFYTGSLAVLTTDRGARICSFTPYGQLQMGRLLIEDRACSGVAARGAYVFVGSADEVWAIDLGTPLDDAGGYAVAHRCGRTSVTGEMIEDLVSVDDTSFLGTTSGGDLVASVQLTAPGTAETMTIVSSWVRFSTTEKKRLHHVSIDGNFPLVSGANALTLTVETASGDSSSFSYPGGTNSVLEYEVANSLPTSPAYRMTITVTAVPGSGAVLRSWQMKALPTPSRRQEIVLPLMLADINLPTKGEKFGYFGFAADRLDALIQYASRSDQVAVVDKRLRTSYRAVIERIQFRQDAAPSPTNGLLGIANVVLRLV